MSDKEIQSQNRSTLYHYLYYDMEFNLRHTKIGKGSYKVFIPPYKWDTAYMKVNEMWITGFQAIILFTNELVVRFSEYEEVQINIPYKMIKTIMVADDLYIGYEELHLNK